MLLCGFYDTGKLVVTPKLGSAFSPVCFRRHPLLSFSVPASLSLHLPSSRIREGGPMRGGEVGGCLFRHKLFPSVSHAEAHKMNAEWQK